jgi:hypothetical protein
MLQKLTFAALALFVSGVAVAAGEGMYGHLDADQDGAISQEEAAAMPGLNDMWTKLDANADGKLDEAEFAKMEVSDVKSEASDVISK